MSYPSVESIQAVQRDMIGAMQKLVERVEKLEVATNSDTLLGRDPEEAWTCHRDKAEEANGIQGARLSVEDVISQDTMLEVVLQI